MTAVSSITPRLSYFELLTEEDDKFHVWRRHWGKDVETIDDGKTMVVQPTLLEPKMSAKLRIFEEYKKLDELIRKEKTGYLIVGSPGIGKSTYLPYKLCLRLADRLPTVYFGSGPELFLFTNKGAYRVRDDAMNRTGLFNNEQYKDIIALVDGDLQEPPRVLWRDSQLSMVLTSSPKRDRYKIWEKHAIAAKIVASAPSFEEAFAAWGLYDNGKFAQMLKSEKEFFQEVWRQYGPNLRLSLDILINGRGALGKHRATILAAVEDLTASALRTLLLDSESGHNTTHKLVESYPSPENPAVICNRVHSLTVWRIIAEKLAKSEISERRHLYNLLHSSPRLSSSLGWLFESMAIDKLSASINFVLKSLTNGPEIALTLPYRMIETFSAQSIPGATSDISKFYVPNAGNNPTWDAFCYHKTHQSLCGLGFQMTVGRDHSVKSKGLQALQHRFAAAGATQYLFVFVTPKDFSFAIPKDVTSKIQQQWSFHHLALDVADLDNHSSAFRAFSSFRCIDKPDDTMSLD